MAKALKTLAAEVETKSATIKIQGMLKSESQK